MSLTGDFKVDFWASPDPGTPGTVLFTTGKSSTDLRISIVSTGSGNYDYVATYLGHAARSSVTGRLDELTITSVPEPSTIALICGGLLSLPFIARRRRRSGRGRSALMAKKGS